MSQPSVYKISLSNNRYRTPILLNTTVGLFKIHGVFDTGAQYTCIPTFVFGEVSDLPYTDRLLKISGVIETAPFTVREISIKQCVLGNIDLGPRNVFVTDADAVLEVVIGMDLISQIDFSQSAFRQELYLSKARQSYREPQIVTTDNVSTMLSRVLKELDMYNLQAMAFCLQCLPENLEMPEDRFRKLIADLVERVS